MFIAFGIIGILLLLSTEPYWPIASAGAAWVYILLKLITAENMAIKWIKALVVIAAVYALWRFLSLPYGWADKIFTPGQMKIIHWAAIASCAGAAGLGVYRFIKDLKPAGEKELKHGPEFCARSPENHAGIEIGEFSRGVLPEIARQFCGEGTFKIILPYNRLSRGVTILADQGAGKTRLMKAIHDGIIKKYPNIPILIHDPKGEWLRALYNPATDLIFAPHDARTCGWRLWEDFKNHPELRHSLITSCVEAHHSGNTDRFWSDSATQLLKSAIAQPNIEAALAFLKMKRKENSDDKTFQSVYATAALSFRDIAGIELTAKETPTTKTIDELLAHKGRIFLLNSPSCSAEQHGPLTLMLSAFLLQAISLHDLAEDELRAAVIMDEALTFRQPAEVERVVYSQSRSKGLCIIASAQRLPDKDYGERGLWSNQANHIFAMRVSDLKTREAFSRRIGNLIYDEKQTSTSTSHTAGEFSGSSGTSTTMAERKHLAMTPESFGALQNREFILFHDLGVAPGVVVDTAAEQRDDIKPMVYTPRDSVAMQLGEL